MDPARRQLRVRGEVVHHLRHKAADVDGVRTREHHAFFSQARGQLLIGKDALHGALGIVEVAAHAADGNVRALLRAHLQLLDAAHLALG